MAHKHVLFRSEAREKILHGASALADAVRVTLGPKSKSVLIEKKWGKPIVCNDGVTIAFRSCAACFKPARLFHRARVVAPVGEHVPCDILM